MGTKRVVLRIAAILVCCSALAGGLWIARAQRALAKAEQLVELGLWPGVRLQTQRYLALHPGDARARLLLAEAWVKDDSLDSKQSAKAAIEQLSRVSNDSELAAAARTQAGRLEFLILGRPERAERLFRAAIDLAPESPDAFYMLWKVLEQTERAHLSAGTFWHLYELTPVEERSDRLRDWYMGQLYPTIANAELDRTMGFLEPGEEASLKSQGRRLAYFKASDPTSSLAYAALAQWFFKQGDVIYASKILEEAVGTIETSNRDAFFAATLISVLIDLGEFDRARAAFEEWPAAREGYEYFKWRAVILDEIEGDFEMAASAYEEALSEWPGPFDWRLRNRWANCLTRAGRKSEAAQVRSEARMIEKNMNSSVHLVLSQALGDLTDAAQLAKVAAFYQRLGCQREAEAWQSAVRRIEGMKGQTSVE